MPYLTKYLLVERFSKLWPEDTNKFKRMNRSQLMAIWFRLKEKHD